MRAFLTSAMMLFAAIVSPAVAQDLKGDEQAVALVQKMIERLGGAQLWSQSQTLHLEYSGWRADPAQAVDEHAWRSLSTPDQRVVFEGQRGDVAFNMREDASWLEFSGREPRRFSAEEHADNLDFWNFDFYTILHNLARGDERIRLRFEAPQTVRILGPQNADWGWFEIDATGQPVRWGAVSGGDALEYVYGPVRAYGNVNFPAWGASTDGFWRFDYLVVDLSREPFALDREAPQ